MASNELAKDRAEGGADWLPRDDAARFLKVTSSHLTETLRHYIVHKSASHRARGPSHVGYLYSRADLERVAVIMQCVGCTARDAGVSLRALRALELRGLLARVASQLELGL